MTRYIDPSQKLLRHTEHLDALSRGKYLAPINAEIMLSNRCDLRCQMCHYSYTHTRGPWVGHADKPDGAISSGDLMEFILARDIVGELASDGVKSITWSGGGEPTLHPHFDEIVKYAHDYGLEQGIYTHGGHLRDGRAVWMKQHFKWIYISFDAYDVESYKQHKGVNRFERVCENIRNLVTLPGNATIGMGFLLHAENYHSVGLMVALGRSLGVDYVQFRPLIAYDQDKPGELVEDTAWIADAIRTLERYSNDAFVIADTSRFSMYANWQGHGYQTCHWSALQTVITPNGMVWRCTNKMEHPDALLGDLSVESFSTLWQRSGGACTVNSGCRILCRGHLANVTLNELFQPVAHGNFV